jgi:hypothetical protein
MIDQIPFFLEERTFIQIFKFLEVINLYAAFLSVNVMENLLLTPFCPSEVG